MDPAHSDDAQHTLEQHALRNVRSLAERLGHADAISRRHDRIILIAIGVLVAAVVAYIGARMAMAPDDPNRLARHRCEVEKSIHLVDRKRLLLKQANPAVTERELVTRATVTDSDVKAEAARLCAGAI